MVMLTSFGSNTAAIFVTCPTLTPLNLTGEPIDSPVIEPSKNITNRSRFWKNLPDPKTRMATAASATAPTTNPPITVFLACLATARLLAAGQEGEHPGVLRFGQELLRVARGDHRLALGVEKHRVVPDGEDARELVRHHHNGGAEAVAQIEDQVVESPRADWVEPRRRLVEEEDVRDERQLERRQSGDLFRANGGGVLLQRQGHVFRQGHRAPERAALVEDSEPSQEALAFGRRHLPETSAGTSVRDRPLGRLLQSDQVPEQRALSAAAPSHDDEDVALVHGEVEVLHDHGVAVGHGEVAHGDFGTRFHDPVAAPFKYRGHKRWP